MSGHSELGFLSNLGKSSNFTWVSRYCISCLSCESWQSCNNIHDICSSHLGRRRALFNAGSRVVFHFATSEPDSAFVFQVLGFQLRILEVTHVHQCGKVDFPLVSVCFQDSFPFALDFFFKFHACLELVPFLVHCCFCIRNFHRLRQKNKFVHQIVMCLQSKSFSGNAITTNFRLQRFCSLSRGFVGFPLYNHNLF